MGYILMHVFELVFLFSLDKYPVVGLLDCMVVLFFIYFFFWGKMVFPWKITRMYPNLLISFPMTKVYISTDMKKEVVQAINKTYPPTVLPQQVCPYTQWSWKLCKHNVFEKHKFPLEIARSQPNPWGGREAVSSQKQLYLDWFFLLLSRFQHLAPQHSICTYKETKATSQPPIKMESGQCGLYSRNSTSLPFQGHRATYTAENTSRAGPLAGSPREKWKANKICLPSPQFPIFFFSLYLPLLISCCSFFLPSPMKPALSFFFFYEIFFRMRKDSFHSLILIWNKLPLNQMRNIPLLQVRPKPLVSFKIFKSQEHVMNKTNPPKVPAQGRTMPTGGAHDL